MDMFFLIGSVICLLFGLICVLPVTRKRKREEEKETSESDKLEEKKETSESDKLEEIYSDGYKHVITDVKEGKCYPFERAHLGRKMQSDFRTYITSDYFNRLDRIDKSINKNAKNLDSDKTLSFRFDDQGQCTEVDESGQNYGNLQVQINKKRCKGESTTAAIMQVPYGRTIKPLLVQNGLRRSCDTGNQYFYFIYEKSDTQTKKFKKPRKEVLEKDVKKKGLPYSAYDDPQQQ
ncbi:hypothetical protein CHS0354_028716 [Potamilus streckersoni]|uniref:Uncharacterized protein n=1 Tax=Potamilus streckersoni TaxID=2493646 RepID=A0AAE0SYN5_9BIVA|nr:hypothetical protein CHS0354_028716 [Potamilus streckersoni]